MREDGVWMTEDCPICTGSAAGIPQRSDSFHAE